jgi:hypothetical protein
MLGEIAYVCQIVQEQIGAYIVCGLCDICRLSEVGKAMKQGKCNSFTPAALVIGRYDSSYP